MKLSDEELLHKYAVALGRKGGKARMMTLTPERRSEIARNAVLTRYYGKATLNPKNSVAAAMSRLAHDSMTPEQRVERAKRAADVRWHKTKN